MTVWARKKGRPACGRDGQGGGCRALMRDGATPAPRGEDLTGTSGSVVTAIPAGGYGEVLVYLAGQPVKYAAKSAAPVARGAEVWVESVLSPTSVAVRPVER
ncbi:hypothetical protein GCM10017562_75460 [Streptomyces roseofulvus]